MNLLVPIVVKKLPVEVSHDESIWSLAVLRRQLRREVEAKEKSKLRQFNNDTLAKSHLPTLTSADALLSGFHPFDLCKIFPLVDERPDILCRHRRFFKCLEVLLLETVLLAMWWEPLRGSLQVSGNTGSASYSYWDRGIERGRK